MKKISIGHGSGGRLTRELIEKIFLKHLSSDELAGMEDAAIVEGGPSSIAVTTDSYVVRPLFFPGGDIGKLSVCGTVNDLTVSGALPRFLSAGFILEEGLPIEHLERVVRSMSEAAKAAGVNIVAADTKVVERNKCDGIYINTAGIGKVVRELTSSDVSDGDAVIVTGTMGDHGTSIAIARNEFEIDSPVESDCASLNALLAPLFRMDGIKWMRDPTRGGLATVLAELSHATGLGIRVVEEKIPVREDVRFISDMLGYDPLYLANEGKAVIIASQEVSREVLKVLRSNPLGENAAVIGHVTSGFRGVRMSTAIGGERALDILEEETLPRIC
jgi:hydrogenase expression/formation protein HypE